MGILALVLYVLGGFLIVEWSKFNPRGTPPLWGLFFLALLWPVATALGVAGFLLVKLFQGFR